MIDDKPNRFFGFVIFFEPLAPLGSGLSVNGWDVIVELHGMGIGIRYKV